MNVSISDPDVNLLAGIAEQLQADYSESVAWSGSPFEWIKGYPPSRTKGAIGEKLVERFFATKGFVIEASPDSDADRIINGVRTEIKFSMLWEGGFYKFQQLRDQNYQVAVCLGISPFNAHCWVLPKSKIMEEWRSHGGIGGQHGGSAGSDTAWLHVNPEQIPSWLSPYGGTLAEATRVLNQTLRRLAGVAGQR